MSIENFVAVAQGIMDRSYEDMGLQPQFRETLAVAKGGRKFSKIVRVRASGEVSSVHCFVENETGNILKAASFKSPAKHARGNINDADGGASAMSPYGAVYL